MGLFNGRTVFVTGAGRGIGAAIARRLASEGAALVLADIVKENVDAIGTELRASGADCTTLALDVTSEAGWQAAMDEVSNRKGVLHGLVNNAGILVARTLEDTPLNEWLQQIEVNLTGPFLGTKAALPLLKATSPNTLFGTAIVNICSVSGVVGTPGSPGYAATKGGLRAFTKSVAIDFAKRGYRVRVNSVHPGLTETEMVQRMFEGKAREGSGASAEDVRQAWRQSYPLGRISEPNEIANVVCFLLSDQASYMTGAELLVDGGMTAQ